MLSRTLDRSAELTSVLNEQLCRLQKFAKIYHFSLAFNTDVSGLFFIYLTDSGMHLRSSFSRRTTMSCDNDDDDDDDDDDLHFRPMIFMRNRPSPNMQTLFLI